MVKAKKKEPKQEKTVRSFSLIIEQTLEALGIFARVVEVKVEAKHIEFF